MNSTRPHLLNIESFEDRVLPSAFGLSGFGLTGLSNPLPVSQWYHASDAIGGTQGQEINSPISLTQQPHNSSNAFSGLQGQEVDSPISLNGPSNAIFGMQGQGVNSPISSNQQLYHQIYAENGVAFGGEQQHEFNTPISLNQQLDSNNGLLGQAAFSHISLFHQTVIDGSFPEWSNDPRVYFLSVDGALLFDNNFELIGVINFNGPNEANPFWGKLGDVGVSDNDSPAQSNEAPNPTQSVSDTSVPSSTPGILLVSQSSQQATGQSSGSEQLTQSENHALADLKLQAISVTGIQPVFSMTSFAATQVFGNYSTSLASDILPRTVSSQASLNLNSLASSQSNAAIDSLRSAVSPIAITPTVDNTVVGVINLNAAKLDASLNHMLGSMTTLGLELAEEVEQPELYTYYIAAGLLGLGAGYTVWLNKKSRQSKRFLLRSGDNSLWGGEKL